MSTQNSSIQEISNAGIADINVSIHMTNGTTLSFLLAPGSKSDLINIPLDSFSQSAPLLLTVSYASSELRPRVVYIYAENTGTTNTFYATTIINSVTQPYKQVNQPTKLGANVSLSVLYSGDGVVVVGTGDL